MIRNAPHSFDVTAPDPTPGDDFEALGLGGLGLATEVQTAIFPRKICGADNGPRVPRQTVSPGGCSTGGHHGKGKLAFGLLNRSPVWSFFRLKLLNRFDHSLPHRKSTSSLPPAADVKGCTSLSPGLPSRPGEFHPEPLTEPDVILSHHPAHAIARRLPPSAEQEGSSRANRLAQVQRR